MPILLDFEIKDFSSLLSDVHSPLMVTMKFALQNEQSIAHSLRVDNKCVKINKWDKILENQLVKNIESKEILSEVNGIDLNNVTKTKLDNIVDKLGCIYINSAKKAFGTKGFSSKIRRKNNENVKKNVYKPWLNEDCKNKQRLFRKLNRIKHRSTFHRDLAKEAEKEYKKELNKSQAKYRQDLQDKMQNLKHADPIEYWKLLKEGSHKKQPNIDFENLVKFFENLNKGLEDDDGEINMELTNTEIDANRNEFLNSPITTDEMLKCVKRMKNDKACSDDKIVNEYIIYKSSIQKFLKLFEKLFNLIFVTGNIPNTWLKGTIKLFYKNKGNRLDPKNYRPITIVSCLGKVFT